VGGDDPLTAKAPSYNLPLKDTLAGRVCRIRSEQA